MEFLGKVLNLNLSFQRVGQVFANFSFNNFIILGKCLGFQFLSLGIRTYFLIPTGF